MNQIVYVVFSEKRYEPETLGVCAVFDTEELANKYKDVLLSKRPNTQWHYFVNEYELLTDLP